MKIFVSILSYGIKQNNHLITILNEYDKISSSNNYKIDIEIISNIISELPVYKNIKIRFNIHQQQIIGDLGYIHRNSMNNLKDKYDLFIYTENDILITEKNINHYLKISSKLPDNYITGFLRVEISNDKKYVLIDHNMYYFPTYKKRITINNELYVQLNCLHQGCWILTQKQLHKALNSGNFFQT